MLDAVHKTLEVRAWLAENPRFHSHFTPTSTSWSSLVEIRFGVTKRQTLHRTGITSVSVLQARFRAFVTGCNDPCHPFVCTKTHAPIPDKANCLTT
ncbi:hypothetical protein GCM10011374_06980 [Kocuria dechangensis]|uniref:Transposase n=1 Tax=Kocuria dechangensis TaxID=1176249 RepID=A0A917GII1_9MICC|nr:hypothetical protein GCM10011374_06980 [Kocuria dechangensis]